jgi:hypothetical protein
VCGIPLPAGLARGRRAPRAAVHPRDEGRARRARRERAVRRDGRRARAPLAEELRAVARRVRRGRGPRGVGRTDPRRHQARVRARRRRAGGEELLLIDEVLTPDSSRYWPADRWAPGGSPPSFDKQYVRDHVSARAGTGAAGTGAARRGRRRDASALRRGLRAHHRHAVRGLVAGWGRGRPTARFAQPLDPSRRGDRPPARGPHVAVTDPARHHRPDAAVVSSSSPSGRARAAAAPSHGRPAPRARRRRGGRHRDARAAAASTWTSSTRRSLWPACTPRASPSVGAADARAASAWSATTRSTTSAAHSRSRRRCSTSTGTASSSPRSPAATTAGPT